MNKKRSGQNAFGALATAALRERFGRVGATGRQTRGSSAEAMLTRNSSFALKAGRQGMARREA